MGDDAVLGRRPLMRDRPPTASADHAVPIDAEQLRDGMLRLRAELDDIQRESKLEIRELEAALASRQAASRYSVSAALRRQVRHAWASVGRAVLRVVPQPLVAILWHNPLFDRSWYLTRYPDVDQRGTGAERHYRRHGSAEGRNPNAYFDTRWYLSRYRDVAAGKLNPLDHYHYYGSAEGRDPGPRFDTDLVCGAISGCPCVRPRSILHFLRIGEAEGRAPHGRSARHASGESADPNPSPMHGVVQRTLVRDVGCR